MIYGLLGARGVCISWKKREMIERSWDIKVWGIEEVSLVESWSLFWCKSLCTSWGDDNMKNVQCSWWLTASEMRMKMRNITQRVRYESQVSKCLLGSTLESWERERERENKVRDKFGPKLNDVMNVWQRIIYWRWKKKKKGGRRKKRSNGREDKAPRGMRWRKSKRRRSWAKKIKQQRI